MFHFLGIVADDDYKAGKIIPSYILCQAHGKSENRSGWRVIKQNKDSSLLNMPKVLVNSLTGHEDMIDFLSSYRTRDHMHGDKHYDHDETKKYYPVGAMFWFSCNEYGEPGNYAVFITTVPVDRSVKVDSGFERLKVAQQRKLPLKEQWTGEPKHIEDEYSDVKPRLVQNEQRKKGKNI